MNPNRTSVTDNNSVCSTGRAFPLLSKLLTSNHADSLLVDTHIATVKVYKLRYKATVSLDECFELLASGSLQSWTHSAYHHHHNHYVNSTVINFRNPIENSLKVAERA